MPIDDEFVRKMTGHVTAEIEARLREAHLVATNARSFSSQGLEERSVETLLDVEPLIFEAKALLEAMTVLRRARAA